MAKENTTLDNLARMVQRGFTETAAKAEVGALRDDVAQLHRDVEAGFSQVAGILSSIQ